MNEGIATDERDAPQYRHFSAAAAGCSKLIWRQERGAPELCISAGGDQGNWQDATRIF